MIVWKLHDKRTGIEFYLSPLKGNWIGGYDVLNSWQFATLGM